jgi:hypothetical protein
MNDCDSLEALEAAVAACRAFGFAEDKHVDILPGTQSIVLPDGRHAARPDPDQSAQKRTGSQ